jgi:hypothetical protein
MTTASHLNTELRSHISGLYTCLSFAEEAHGLAR